ncbi:MAG: hypothetical protein ACTSU5_01525 [Promethearchaeota archaeon]
MNTSEAASRLSKSIDDVRSLLFPPGFERVGRDLLASCLGVLTGALNECLDAYHELESFDEKMEVKPTLVYCQEVLATMSRLMKFGDEHLTVHNQILLDLQRMLLERENMVGGKFKRFALTELHLLNDPELKRLLEAALSTYFF